mmetsp:Transcript_27884/g.31342  ORF Transcript_27884/g.31342 Transcript_27884/m.31342 type:complete len:299 (-) Transcript_27884:22-918(-)
MHTIGSSSSGGTIFVCLLLWTILTHYGGEASVWSYLTGATEDFQVQENGSDNSYDNDNDELVSPIVNREIKVSVKAPWPSSSEHSVLCEAFAFLQGNHAFLDALTKNHGKGHLVSYERSTKYALELAREVAGLDDDDDDDHEDEEEDEVVVVEQEEKAIEWENEDENNGNNDCGDIQIIGSTGKNAIADFAHPRGDCVKYPFEIGPKSKLYCPKCYCYVCDVLVSECTKWDTHCQAVRSVSKWQSQREYQRSKRKRQAMTKQDKAKHALQQLDTCFTESEETIPPRRRTRRNVSYTEM